MSVSWKEQKYRAGDDALSKEFPDYEVVEQRIGNQTNADSNNNKFFSCELHKSSNGKWRVYTNYGRVSTDEYTGAVGVFGPGSEIDARSFFEKKFRSKCTTSGGYEEIKFVKAKVGSPLARAKIYKVSESEIPDDKKQKLIKESSPTTISIDPVLSRLVEQWYRESSNAITNNSAVTITSNGLETPLGVLTFAQLQKGQTILGDLGEAVKSNDKPEIIKLTNAFYSNIPAKLGRKITDSDLINTDIIIQQKIDLIQMMIDALEVGGSTFTSDTVKKYVELGIRADFVSHDSDEFKTIQKGVSESRGWNHKSVSNTIKNIFRVEIPHERSRFNTCTIDNEQILYHGSRNMNILGILKSGLKIAPPEAPVSGYMFGKGNYFSCQSTKSIQYSLYSFPGMGNIDNCFLFLNRVKLGKQLKLTTSDSQADKKCKKLGFDSTWGQKGRSLYHDEFIVYDVAQSTITHILEIKR